ncbi:patatin-like phospholipase family protein [Ramlibacter sp. XY19]|uniref:patatin-like phospholipase family protein n=1 Tax=Ramlibacter paludis TaxID=2908000 RepID=UPI0023D99F16|nr:patatin-like phospholipase family protein [Ramlibacter paludis]MCG2592363.1 patatin-like phospholipase family protein [Ramlibacter paludis]
MAKSGENVPNSDGGLRVLTLDGGGSKGFYTLGVLHELEAMVGCRLCDRFDLIYGTSTGSIIGTLLALGQSVDQIHTLYKQHVPAIMGAWTRDKKSAALAALADEVFGKYTFADMKTRVGIVATKWMTELPMIFKGDPAQAFGRKGSFRPGFGVSLAKAVQASCSAYPFFNRTTVVTDQGEEIELFDGGFCANNPTLYAIADAAHAIGSDRRNLRVVNVGVGEFPAKRAKPHVWAIGLVIPTIELTPKILEVNTKSMEQLRSLLFSDVQTVRISDMFDEPALATDFLESDLAKLDLIRQRGRDSFASRETVLSQMLS